MTPLQIQAASENVEWSSKEVVRDIDGKPHLFVRVTLQGRDFPERALRPYVAIGRRQARFVQIVDAGQRLHAYFDASIPEEGAIEMGYEDGPFVRVPRGFDSRRVARLDKSRLPPELGGGRPR